MSETTQTTVVNEWIPIGGEGHHPPIGIYVQFKTISGLYECGYTADLCGQPPNRKHETVFVSTGKWGRRVYLADFISLWREY
jgi:hypothetical protein